jgi:hypothetical protein
MYMYIWPFVGGGVLRIGPDLSHPNHTPHLNLTATIHPHTPTPTPQKKQQLKNTDPEAETLFAGIKAGDPTAIGKLQQKFADKYFGGAFWVFLLLYIYMRMYGYCICGGVRYSAIGGGRLP